MDSKNNVLLNHLFRLLLNLIEKMNPGLVLMVMISMVFIVNTKKFLVETEGKL